MFNPLQVLTDAFREHYRVSFSMENPDGSIMLTLSHKGAIVARRMVSPAQRREPKRLDSLIQSIRFGIAIDSGQSPNQVLFTLHDSENAPIRSQSAADPHHPTS